MATENTKIRVRLFKPTNKQTEAIRSVAKRKIIRAGRRGGKTTGVAILAVEKFLQGKRVLYAAPTTEQIETFWKRVVAALHAPIDAGVFKKNETEHIIELVGTEQRIRAKTAWNADTLRGDYADILILDEWQLMNEDAWEVVGAPMLLDNNGDAIFIYTPPSLHSRSASKANDPRHAAKLYKKALSDDTGRWGAYTWTSFDNPHLSREALSEISQDMTQLAMQQEIYAQDREEVPGALWKQELIDTYRVTNIPEFARIAIGVDPSGGAAEIGIVVAALGIDGHGYLLDDRSLHARPANWGAEVVAAFKNHKADKIVAEKNYGGEMVEHTIRSFDGGKHLPLELITSSRGKILRAEPIAALYERGLVHHVGIYTKLEEEMCSYVPGAKSPNRLDAMVFALTELMEGMSWTDAEARAVEIEEMEAVTIGANY